MYEISFMTEGTLKHLINQANTFKIKCYSSHVISLDALVIISHMLTMQCLLCERHLGTHRRMVPTPDSVSHNS